MSIPLPTSFEFAASFGIEDEKELYKARFLDPNDDFDEAMRLILKAFRKDDLKSQAVLNEFGCLFLPRFVEACLSAPARVEPVFWFVLQMLIRFPPFAIYLRTCPDSKFLFKRYTEKYLLSFPTSAFELSPDSAGSRRKIQAFYCWSLICYEICLHVAYPTPDTSPPTPTEATVLLGPSIKKDLISKLGKLHSWLSPTLRTVDQEWFLMATECSKRIFTWATNQQSLGDLLAGVDKFGTTALPYIHCARTRHGGCVAEREEVLGCSKCESVRYCSRKHQKDDWMEHKQLCFKPTW
ncbi:hypothetical protein BDY24DRAFT_381280 [Mrakia frigida]|uniref:zinc finger MYND domain-containing protein n=1 Tax=Mrakia frigida TaxID=29902 RepID=UPI003FCC03C5